MVQMAKFEPLPAPTWSEMVQTELKTPVVVFWGIIVALLKLALKLMSRAGDGQNGQFWAPMWSDMVQTELQA